MWWDVVGRGNSGNGWKWVEMGVCGVWRDGGRKDEGERMREMRR